MAGTCGGAAVRDIGADEFVPPECPDDQPPVPPADPPPPGLPPAAVPPVDRPETSIDKTRVEGRSVTFRFSSDGPDRPSSAGSIAGRIGDASRRFATAASTRAATSSGSRPSTLRATRTPSRPASASGSSASSPVPDPNRLRGCDQAERAVGEPALSRHGVEATPCVRLLDAPAADLVGEVGPDPAVLPWTPSHQRDLLGGGAGRRSEASVPLNRSERRACEIDSVRECSRGASGGASGTGGARPGEGVGVAVPESGISVGELLAELVTRRTAWRSPVDVGMKRALTMHPRPGRRGVGDAAVAGDLEFAGVGAVEGRAREAEHGAAGVRDVERLDLALAAGLGVGECERGGSRFRRRGDSDPARVLDAGAADEVVVLVATVEVRAADRVGAPVGPVDVPAGDRDPAGSARRARVGDQVLDLIRAVLVRDVRSCSGPGSSSRAGPRPGRPRTGPRSR